MAVILAQQDWNTNMQTEPKHKNGLQTQQNQGWKYSKLSEHIWIRKNPVNWDKKVSRAELTLYSSMREKYCLKQYKNVSFIFKSRAFEVPLIVLEELILHCNVDNFTACSLKTLEMS